MPFCGLNRWSTSDAKLETEVRRESEECTSRPGGAIARGVRPPRMVGLWLLMLGVRDRLGPAGCGVLYAEAGIVGGPIEPGGAGAAGVAPVFCASNAILWE